MPKTFTQWLLVCVVAAYGPIAFIFYCAWCRWFPPISADALWEVSKLCVAGLIVCAGILGVAILPFALLSRFEGKCNTLEAQVFRPNNRKMIRITLGALGAGMLFSGLLQLIYVQTSDFLKQFVWHGEITVPVVVLTLFLLPSMFERFFFHPNGSQHENLSDRVMILAAVSFVALSIMSWSGAMQITRLGAIPNYPIDLSKIADGEETRKVLRPQCLPNNPNQCVVNLVMKVGDKLVLSSASDQYDWSKRCQFGYLADVSKLGAGDKACVATTTKIESSVK